MHIQVTSGALVKLGKEFSLLLQEDALVPGQIKAWPIENKELLKLFPEEREFDAQIFPQTTIGIFNYEGKVGYISVFPEGKCEIICRRGSEFTNHQLILPRTVWITEGSSGYVRVGAVEEDTDVDLDTPLFSLAGPNWIGPYTICFGDDPLPTKPTDIFEEFLRRPFSNGFENFDLRSYLNSNGDRKMTIRQLLSNSSIR